MQNDTVTYCSGGIFEKVCMKYTQQEYNSLLASKKDIQEQQDTITSYFIGIFLVGCVLIYAWDKHKWTGILIVALVAFAHVSAYYLGIY